MENPLKFIERKRPVEGEADKIVFKSATNTSLPHCIVSRVDKLAFD